MPRPSRRRFLAASALAVTAAGCSKFHPFGIGTKRPTIVGGVASGDVTADAAMIRAIADRGARLHVDWDTTDSFKNATHLVGPDAVSRSGYTAKLDLRGLPADTRIFYRVRFENLDDFSMSEPEVGSFKTPARDDAAPKDVCVAWSGDTAGQGWGIDPARGGMRAYKAMADVGPDLFIHSGDTVYADGPIEPEVKLPDGQVWRNIVTPAKSKPAETLDEFRGAHAYNLLDAHVRRFNASVPMVAQWDDHEVRNNWCPGQTLTDPKYAIERSTDVLSGRARQAFLEYHPIRPAKDDAGRIYRSYRHGPLLEVFLLDERSYRGINNANRQPKLDADCQFLAPLQLEWLKAALKKSTAVWKVIASDMPLSCVSTDGKDVYEAWANGDKGGPLGRELELADLLSFIKRNRVRNTLFVTADVHFPANIHYHPDRATAFKDFDPFWEFITGPLHAGGFGPSTLDKTFGPEYRFKNPPKKGGDGPGMNFGAFGVMRIDARTKTMRVTQHDLDGREMAAEELTPS